MSRWHQPLREAGAQLGVGLEDLVHTFDRHAILAYCAAQRFTEPKRTSPTQHKEGQVK